MKTLENYKYLIERYNIEWENNSDNIKVLENLHTLNLKGSEECGSFVNGHFILEDEENENIFYFLPRHLWCPIYLLGEMDDLKMIDCDSGPALYIGDELPIKSDSHKVVIERFEYIKGYVKIYTKTIENQ